MHTQGCTNLSGSYTARVHVCEQWEMLVQLSFCRMDVLRTLKGLILQGPEQGAEQGFSYKQTLIKGLL